MSGSGSVSRQQRPPSSSCCFPVNELLDFRTSSLLLLVTVFPHIPSFSLVREGQLGQLTLIPGFYDSQGISLSGVSIEFLLDRSQVPGTSCSLLVFSGRLSGYCHTLVPLSCGKRRNFGSISHWAFPIGIHNLP